MRSDFMRPRSSAHFPPVHLLGPAILLVGLLLSWSPPSAAVAVHQPIAEVAVDVDTTGNTTTALGPRDACRIIPAVGDSLQVDITVRGVPPFEPNDPSTINDNSDGIAGASLDLLYDPSIIKITAINLALLLAADGPPIIFSFGDPVPDADGDLRVDVAELSGYAESGDGVVARITVEAVGQGTSIVDLSNHLEVAPLPPGTPQIWDASGQPYNVTNIFNGLLAVGDSPPCGTPGLMTIPYLMRSITVRLPSTPINWTAMATAMETPATTMTTTTG